MNRHNHTHTKLTRRSLLAGAAALAGVAAVLTG